MILGHRNRVEPELFEEIIEVQLCSSEPEPPKYKVSTTRRLAYWAFYGGLSYASFKGFELYSGVHASIAFELGESAIAGTAAAAFMVKVQEAEVAKRSEASTPIE